jgi:hypothetical protein
MVVSAKVPQQVTDHSFRAVRVPCPGPVDRVFTPNLRAPGMHFIAGIDISSSCSCSPHIPSSWHFSGFKLSHLVEDSMSYPKHHAPRCFSSVVFRYCVTAVPLTLHPSCRRMPASSKSLKPLDSGIRRNDGRGC